MKPRFYRPLGRMERWLATRADNGFYTNVLAFLRLSGDPGSDPAALRAHMARRVAALAEELPNLRLLLKERSRKAPQEFYVLESLPETALPLEVRETAARDESSRDAELEKAMEELLLRGFPVLGPSADIIGPAPKHPERDRQPEWSHWLRWRMILLVHPAGEDGLPRADVAMAYAHDIADGKSGPAILKMLVDPDFVPYAEYDPASFAEGFGKYPDALPPIDAVAKGTMPPVSTIVAEAFKELVIPSWLKRKFFLEDYWVGFNDNGSEKGADVKTVDEMKRTPARVRLITFPAPLMKLILAACKARGSRLHAVLLTASLHATASILARVAARSASPSKTQTGVAARHLPRSQGKQQTIKLRVNSPVDLRAVACSLPDETGKRMPIGVFIGIANTDHVLRYPPPETAGLPDGFWDDVAANADQLVRGVSTAVHIHGVMSFIGDSSDWYAMQQGNRKGYPGGRMESVMVSNARTWSVPTFEAGGRWAADAGGFSQDNEITGAVLDLDVTTVNGVLTGALNWREGIGSIDEATGGDITRWVELFTGIMEKVADEARVKA
ncbi:hypothetical protein DFJ74DRAFT_658810 [Hyaloraphidium curvatum]|nr:hypothetical protein DFJ74DRAFT_658810 [Hyaloraphidium curvatum]